MRILTIIVVLACAGMIVPGASAQTGDPLSQYQNAVQIRMDDLVRHATKEFFTNAQLEPAEVTQVLSTSKFDIDDSGASIASLDLKVVMTSDQPPEVVRQLRQFIGQSLNREGFVLDQFSGANPNAPALSMVIEVRKPTDPFSKYNIPQNWREYGVLGLIVVALLSTLFFGGYLLMLPFAWRRRKGKVLSERMVVAVAREPVIEELLPDLPSANLEVLRGSGLPSLDLMLAQEKERQNFPVWLNGSGVRMANIEAIRKAFEVLPFDEAIEMLSCMDDNDRTVILSRLKLNNSVKDRIGKELASRVLAPNP